jgi:hypothetical protein
MKHHVKKKAHYVDNARLYKDLCEYQFTGTITNSIAEAIICIAAHRKDSHIFVGYTYDDMVPDAVEVCLKAVAHFDPAVSRNPFGYFSQCVFFSFLQRIKKEAKAQGVMNHIEAVGEYLKQYGYASINY